MSCENCEDQREKDGATPDCETEKGCIIPPLPPDGERLLGIRKTIMRLKDLIGPEVVLKMYKTRLKDLEMLAFIESEYEAQKPQPEEAANDW